MVRSRKWHEVEIYRTRGGKWVGSVWFNAGYRDDESTVMVADTQDDLRQDLLKYEHADSNSYKLALSEALNDDEIFVEEIE